MAEEQKIEQYASPEEELQALEDKLAEKRKELEDQGVEVPPERDMFREILREHIQKSRTPTKPAPEPSAQPLPSHLQTQADDLKKKEEWEEQVKHLIELALGRSVESAVKVAEQATPYLLDELHDHLVDNLYEKLVALRKIKAL